MLTDTLTDFNAMVAAAGWSEEAARESKALHALL